eukprot:7804628-Lingulodinium_polyedra.AAC.1
MSISPSINQSSSQSITERRTQHRMQNGQNASKLRDIVTERRLECVVERRMTVKNQNACS